MLDGADNVPPVQQQAHCCPAAAMLRAAPVLLVVLLYGEWRFPPRCMGGMLCVFEVMVLPAEEAVGVGSALAETPLALFGKSTGGC